MICQVNGSVVLPCHFWRHNSVVNTFKSKILESVLMHIKYYFHQPINFWDLALLAASFSSYSCVVWRTTAWEKKHYRLLMLLLILGLVACAPFELDQRNVFFLSLTARVSSVSAIFYYFIWCWEYGYTVYSWSYRNIWRDLVYRDWYLFIVDIHLYS